MNRIYSLKRSKFSGRIVVVSEIAKQNGKGKGSLVAGIGAALISLGLASNAHAIFTPGPETDIFGEVVDGTQIIDLSGAGVVATSTTIIGGGQQHLFNGGGARYTTINAGGAQTVGAGDRYTLPGWSDFTTINSGGLQAVGSINYDGPILESASAGWTTINSGGTQHISSGGIASGTTVNGGGTLNVSSGGSATNVTQLAGGALVANIGTGINSFVGGTNESGAFAVSGAQASNVILDSGGRLNISSGGVASSTIVNNGGAIYVSSGGSSYYTQIKSGGNEYILSGGYGPSATISSGGTQTISFGGIDSGSTIQAGGTQIVGGVAQAASISGTQHISSGGSGVNGLVANGGTVNAASGSFLSGYIINGSGATILASGSVNASSAGGAAITVSGTSNAVTLNGAGASLGSDVRVAGASNALTLQNGVSVASGVSLIDSSNANTLKFNNQSLTIASTSTAGATTVSGWNQFNVTNSASVNLAGNVALAGATSLLSIDATSQLSQSANTVTVTANTLSNAGQIAVDAGQVLNVNGSYQQTGTLQAGINSPTSYGKMVVNGNALLSNAQFTIAPNSTIAAGINYKNVFSATGGTSGSFSPSVYRGISYALVADGSGFDLVTAATPVSSTTPTPLLNGAQSTAMLNQAQATIQIVRDRMEKMDGAVYQGADPNSYFWAAPLAYTARQSASGLPSAAYTQNTGGFAVGMDRPINPDLRVGGAAILQSSSLKGQNSQTRESLGAMSYQLAAYVKQKLAPSTHLNLIVNMAFDQNNSSRLDSIGTPLNATASYKGWHGLVSGELGHRIETGQSKITPLARLDYGYVNIGAYNEGGAGLSNLAVNRQTQSSTIGSVGAKYRYDINEANRVLVRATAGYDFSAKAASLTATDGSGATFTSYGNNPGSFVMQGGVGYEMQTNDNMRIRLNYDYMGRNGGYSNNMINASLIAPF